MFKIIYKLKIKFNIGDVNYNNAGNTRKYPHINHLVQKMNNLDVI